MIRTASRKWGCIEDCTIQLYCCVAQRHSYHLLYEQTKNIILETATEEVNKKKNKNLMSDIPVVLVVMVEVIVVVVVIEVVVMVVIVIVVVVIVMVVIKVVIVVVVIVVVIVAIVEMVRIECKQRKCTYNNRYARQATSVRMVADPWLGLVLT